jgi:hypothetical protein
MERLSATAQATGGMTANQVLFSTLGAVLDFADTCSPGDDLTLLVVRRREAIQTEQTAARNKEVSRITGRLNSVVRPREVSSEEETSPDA